jgi:putative FmdB family regulatory protein
VPTYQYVCTECGEQIEVVQKFTDDPLTIHEADGARLRKVFSPVGIVFKGSGFYRTDSRKGAVTPSAGSSASSEGSSASSDSASSSSGSSGGDKAEKSSSSASGEGKTGGDKGGASAPSAKPASSGEKVA